MTKRNEVTSLCEIKAVYYGQVELIPGIVCDGYVLDDDTAVMSERGTAELLGMNQMALNRMKTNWPPKTLKPFIDEGLSVKTNSVKVVAENSPHKGRNIVVYDSNIIENLIRGYSLALASHSLKTNQRHMALPAPLVMTLPSKKTSPNSLMYLKAPSIVSLENTKTTSNLFDSIHSLVRFHHQISLETLFNGILQAKPGTMVKLYDLEQLGKEMPFNVNSLNAQIA